MIPKSNGKHVKITTPMFKVLQIGFLYGNNVLSKSFILNLYFRVGGLGAWRQHGRVALGLSIFHPLPCSGKKKTQTKTITQAGLTLLQVLLHGVARFMNKSECCKELLR